MQSKAFLSNHPIRTLVFLFLVWKILLLFIAAASPGRGYDTSASLNEPNRHSLENPAGALPAPLRYLLEKLMRWDAIYFVKIANRGYLFEQEWAFGWGFTRAIALLTAGKNFMLVKTLFSLLTILKVSEYSEFLIMMALNLL